MRCFNPESEACRQCASTVTVVSSPSQVTIPSTADGGPVYFLTTDQGPVVVTSKGDGTLRPVRMAECPTARPRGGLGETVVFVATEREGLQERAAIVTAVGDADRRDLLVAGRSGWYPEWAVGHSVRKAARSWHERS